MDMIPRDKDWSETLEQGGYEVMAFQCRLESIERWISSLLRDGCPVHFSAWLNHIKAELGTSVYSCGTMGLHPTALLGDLEDDLSLLEKSVQRYVRWEHTYVLLKPEIWSFEESSLTMEQK